MNLCLYGSLEFVEHINYATDCSDDSDSAHEDTQPEAGSSATKRKRARKILKTPEKKVRVQAVPHSCSSVAIQLCVMNNLPKHI